MLTISGEQSQALLVLHRIFFSLCVNDQEQNWRWINPVSVPITHFTYSPLTHVSFHMIKKKGIVILSEQFFFKIKSEMLPMSSYIYTCVCTERALVSCAYIYMCMCIYTYIWQLLVQNIFKFQIIFHFSVILTQREQFQYCWYK